MIESSFNPADIVFTEKYRPKSVKDVIGGNEKISLYMKEFQKMPHFIFYSRSGGTGKTTLAKAMAHDLGCECLTMNASDERGIDTVRDKVKSFCQNMSHDGQRKIVFMDESDGLTKDAQMSLKNTMETFAKQAVFILTCNDLGKILPVIQQRCILIEFKDPEKIKIHEYLKNICVKENIKFSDEAITKLIDINYPSIRNCVKTLQKLKTLNKDVVAENITNPDEIYKQLWNMVLQKDINGCRKMVFVENVDVILANQWMFMQVLNDDTIAYPIKVDLFRIFANNLLGFRKISDIVNQQIIFWAGVNDMMVALYGKRT